MSVDNMTTCSLSGGVNSGDVEPKMATIGISSAAAICMRPESLETTAFTVDMRSMAWASVVLAAPDAERLLAPARALMPVTGGVSLVRDGLLFARLLAQDGFTLRETMLPLIRLLNGGDLPRTWMI